MRQKLELTALPQGVRKMEKKTTLGLLVANILLICGPGLPFAIVPTKILVDGTEIKTDILPFPKYGSVMVPIRFIAEALGFKITWDGDNENIILRKSDEEILIVTDGRVFKNRKLAMVGEEIEIVHGRAMVTLDFIGKALNTTVLWNRKNKTAAVYDNDKLNNLQKQIRMEKDIIESQIANITNGLETVSNLVEQAYESDKVNLDQQKDTDTVKIESLISNLGSHAPLASVEVKKLLDKKYNPFYLKQKAAKDNLASKINNYAREDLDPLEVRLQELRTLERNIYHVKSCSISHRSIIQN